MILDTDIVVWMLRKHPGALHFAAQIEAQERHLSCVSQLELLFGCRDSKELKDLGELVGEWFTEVLPLTPAATATAVGIMARFALARRPGVHDVLIAVTALNRGEVLATGNVKHFDFIPGLAIKRFRP
ncbi:MAG: PIN domain-containing protein [Terriglobia bacterium]